MLSIAKGVFTLKCNMGSKEALLEGFVEERSSNLDPSIKRHYHVAEVPVPTKDRSHWNVKKFTNHEDMRRFQVQQWQEWGAAARHKAAWELVTDYWIGMKKLHPDELRFQRSITSFKRGKG